MLLYYAKCGSSFDTLPWDTVYLCLHPLPPTFIIFLSNETKQLENIKKNFTHFLLSYLQ